MNFEETIKPFFWVEHEKSTSLCLSNLNYKAEIFDSRADEGFIGNGYDWGSLALVFLEEKMPDLIDTENLILRQICFVLIHQIPKH